MADDYEVRLHHGKWRIWNIRLIEWQTVMDADAISRSEWDHRQEAEIIVSLLRERFANG